jgi:hypothetical protein
MPRRPPTVKNTAASDPFPGPRSVVSGHVNAPVTNDIRNGPILTGPDDEDFDVVPDYTAVGCPNSMEIMVLCLLPMDRERQWRDLSDAVRLRALRRFRLRYEWFLYDEAVDFVESSWSIYWNSQRRN